MSYLESWNKIQSVVEFSLKVSICRLWLVEILEAVIFIQVSGISRNKSLCRVAFHVIPRQVLRDRPICKLLPQTLSSVVYSFSRLLLYGSLYMYTYIYYIKCGVGRQYAMISCNYPLAFSHSLVCVSPLPSSRLVVALYLSRWINCIGADVVKMENFYWLIFIASSLYG